MNNIKLKNVIANFITKSELPYDSATDIAIKTNQIANVALNYAFLKLLDNDMYIEQQLLVQSNYNYGPKRADAIDIKLAVDNYKYFDGIDYDKNDISIVLKISDKLDDTLSQVLNVPTNFILNNNTYLAGTNSGLYQSDDSLNWRKFNNSQLANVKINSYYSDDDKILFAADDGIYLMSCLQNLIPGSTEQVSVYKIDNELATAVHLSGNEIFIGREDGMYYGQYDGNKTIASLKREKTIASSPLRLINKITTLSGTENDVVVGTEVGMYGSYRKKAFSDLNCISAEASYFTCVLPITDDYAYVGTISGAYTYSKQTNDFTPIYDSAGNPLHGIECLRKLDTIYACTDKGLYVLSEDESHFELLNAKLKDLYIKDVIQNDGLTIIATNDSKIYWANTSDIKTRFNVLKINGTFVKFLVKDGITYYLTLSGVYSLELSDKDQTVSIRTLNKFSDEVDVTCSYNGIYSELLIGTTTGLYTIKDGKLQLQDIYNTNEDINVATVGTITIDDAINSIHFILIFGESNYMINTNNGVYILNTDGELHYVLNQYHIFEGEDILDSISVNDILVLVCLTGFYTINDINNVDETELKAYVRLKSKDNYEFTLYDNNIIRLAKCNDKLYTYDNTTKNVDKFKLVYTLLAEGISKYEEQFKNDDVLNISEIKSIGGNYTYAIVDKTIYTYLREYDESIGLNKSSFKILDDGSPTAAALCALNNDDSKFKYLNAMSPTLYANNTIAAKYNSNKFVVVNTANYTGKLGILSTNIELDNNIVGLGTYYYTSSHDDIIRLKNEAHIVATTDGIYANKSNTFANESFSLSDDYIGALTLFTCLPYVSESTLDGLKRYNLYYAITEYNQLLYFNDKDEHEVDIGYLSKIVGTEVDLTNIQVKKLSFPDLTVYNPDYILRTTDVKNNPVVYIATDSGLMSALVNYNVAGLYNIDNNIKDITGNKLSNDVIDIETLSTINSVNAYAALAEETKDILYATKDNKFKKVEFEFGDIIQIRASTNYLYVLAKIDNKVKIYKLPTNDIFNAVKYNVILISDKIYDIEQIDDSLLIAGNTLSAYDEKTDALKEIKHITIDEEGSSIEHTIEATSIVKSYDLYSNKQMIVIITEDTILKYITDALEICKVEDFKKVVDKDIVGYFIRNSDGNAPLDENKKAELFITDTHDMSAMYSIYNDVEFKKSKYEKIYDNTINCLLTFSNISSYVDIPRDQYDEEVKELSTSSDPICHNNLSASQVVVNERHTSYVAMNYIFAGTNTGLVYSNDGRNFELIVPTTTDIDLATKPIQYVYATLDNLIAFVKIDANKYKLKICDIEMSQNFLTVANIVTTKELTIQNVNDIAYVKLDADETLYICTKSGIYKTAFNLQIQLDKNVFSSANCIYDTANNVMIAAEDGLYNISEDKLNKLNDTRILHIYDGTDDNNVYVGGMFGISSGTIANNRISSYSNIDDISANALLSTDEVYTTFVDGVKRYYELKDNYIYDTKDEVSTYHAIEQDFNELYYVDTSEKTLYSMIDYNSSQILIVATNPILLDIYNTTEPLPFEHGLPSDNQVVDIWFDNTHQFIYTVNTNIPSNKRELFARVGNVGKFDKLYFDDTDALTNISYVGNKYIIDDIIGLYSYRNIENVRFFRLILPSKQILNMYKIDDGNMLVGTNVGLYQYKDGEFIKNKVITNGVTNAILKAAKADDDTNIIQYYVSLGGKLYESALASKNLNLFDLILDMANANVKNITSIVANSRREYTLATTSGLFITQDLFQLSNTFELQTLAAVKERITEYYNNAIEQHILKHHTLDSSVTIANNNKMPVDFSEIANDWQLIDEISGNIIYNDIVDTVEFQGDVNFIQAQYSNFTTNYDKQLSTYSYEPLDGLTYIVKNWKSNIKEIYVYLPTTNTNYVNHIDGTPGCVNSSYKFKRNDMTVELSGSVNDACTKFRLLLDNKHFELADVYDIAINGNSLPLNIYVDTSKTDIGNANMYYHSYILPSVSKFVPMRNNITNSMLQLSGDYAVFDFCCFGTDAQAIKITAKTPNAYYIKYNSFDASSGSMEMQKVHVDQVVQLNSCKYVKDGYVFKGWSTTLNGPVVYLNMQQVVNLTFLNNVTIELYACWKFYTFDDSADTILKLNSNKKLFMIANGEFAENESNVVIDYSYVGDTQLKLMPTGKLAIINSGTLLPNATNVIVEY